MRIKIIARILAGVKRDPSLVRSITPSTDLLGEIGLDSVELTEFMLQLEEELNLAIDYDRFELQHLRSVQSLIKFLDGDSHGGSPGGDDWSAEGAGR